jgi:hypothetical protein
VELKIQASVFIKTNLSSSSSFSPLDCLCNTQVSFLHFIRIIDIGCLLRGKLLEPLVTKLFNIFEKFNDLISFFYDTIADG